MITTNNNDFSDNYSQLFANASKALRAKYPNDDVYKNIEILTLEEYFAHLNKLYELSEEVLKDDNGEIIANIQNGKTYGILPLQEPIIPIDANTRKITVPKEMQNIGVAGDFGAEILYFVIDRYFDNHDLAADDITTVIEWSNPNVTQGEKRGRQRAYTTLTNIPAYLSSDINKNLTGSKLLIGWALGGDVMSAAGTIEFTIRFYQLNEDEIVYSWSTTPEKLTISKTLQYSLFDDIDDSVNDIVSQRIKNMSSSGTGGLLNPPVFFINLDVTGNEEDKSKVTDYTAENGVYYIDIPAGSEEYIATIAARSGTHDCEYTWQYHDINTNGAYSPYDSELYYNDYDKVTADMNREGLIMYVKEDDRYIRAESVTDSDIENGNIFYKVNKCKIKQPGYYKARATIRTSSANAKAESYILIVPGPAKPVIENVANNAQISNNNGYISVILSDDNNADISVKVIDDTQDSSNETSYTWNKHNSANSYNTSTIPVGDYIGFEGNDTNSLTLTECGWYKISATNRRNYSQPSAASNEIYYRVTNKAQSIYISDDLDRNIQAGPNAKPTFTVSTQDANNNDISFDRIEVQWYRQDSASQDQDTPKGSLKTYYPSNFTNGKLQISYDDQVSDGYGLGQMAYAKIVTYYNNDSASQDTSVITFVTF